MENNIICEENEALLIKITPSKIEENETSHFVSSDSAGSILVFNGTARNNEDGKNVKFLYYEAYPEMAIKEIKKLINKAFENYDLIKVAVIHRTGKVGIGEASISIAVSSPHRDDSYLASRFLIDNIKETVPVWKKEAFEDHEKWKKI